MTVAGAFAGILPYLALGVIPALMLVAVSAYLLLTRSSAP
jgi:hypothetical protein